MAKSRKLSPERAVPKEAPEQAPYWAFFFQDQRSPLLRSQLVTALLAGTPLEVERLPPGALLDAVLFCMAAREYHSAEIIDDYSALLRRTDTLWKEPTHSRKVFDQIHSSTADFVLRGLNEFAAYEESYIPELVGWYLNHDAPEYFGKELV